MEFIEHLLGLIFLFVILIGPLPFSLAILHSFFPANKDPIHTLFLLLSFWCALSISLATVLGVFSLFNAGMILAVEAGLLVGGGLLWSRMLQAGAALPGERLAGKPAFDRGEMALAGLLALQGLILLWYTVATPIQDFDSLFYHLPQMAEWYQNGNLDRIAGLAQVSYYPFTWELLSTLFLFPFQSDFLAGIPNWIAWVLSGLGIVVIAEELGAERKKALLCAGFFLAMPILLQHVATLSVDLAFSAFFLVCLACVLAFNRTRLAGYLGLLGVSAGITMGIKMSGVGYLAVAAAVLGVLELRMWLKRPVRQLGPEAERQQLRLSPPVWVYLIGYSLLGVIIGGYWYVDNLIHTGNPLGYIEVGLGDFVIFPGNQDIKDYLTGGYPNNLHLPDVRALVDGYYGGARTFGEYIQHTSLAYLFDTGDGNHRLLLLEALKDYGGFSLAFLVFFTAAWLVGLVRRRSALGGFRFLLCAGLLTVTWTLYWFTPYSGENGSHAWLLTPWIGQALRYGFPFFSLLAVSAACGASAIGFPNAWIAALLAIPMILFFRQADKIPETLVLLAAVGLPLAWLRARGSAMQTAHKPLQLWVLGGVMLLVLVYAFSFVSMHKRFERQDQVYGGIYQFIDAASQPGTKIGYIHGLQTYLIYGRHLDRVLVRAWADPNMKRNAWLRRLRENDFELIAIGPLRGERWNAAPEYQWLQDRTLFEPVYGDSIFTGVVFYRLIP